MDRKSLVILAASFGLLLLWYPLTNRLFPPHAPAGADQRCSCSTRPGVDQRERGPTR